MAKYLYEFGLRVDIPDNDYVYREYFVLHPQYGYLRRKFRSFFSEDEARVWFEHHPECLCVKRGDWREYWRLREEQDKLMAGVRAEIKARREWHAEMYRKAYNGR